jgi:choice-of-anchor A domain-containing protein
MKEVPNKTAWRVVKRLSRSPLAIAVASLCLGLAPSAFAVPVDLGGAADYAVLGEGGSGSFSVEKVYQSDTVINGNVGMGPYTSLNHYVDATINGRFDFDLTDSAAQVATQTTGAAISGGVHQIDLSGIVKDARDASSTAAGYAPTQTYSTLSEGQTITGNGGLNVIRITGDVTLKTSLTLSGSASDQFIFQFTSGTSAGHDVLNLSGMTMVLNGVLPDNILWNLTGLGGDVNISSGSVVFGNFLAPDRNLTSDHGNIEGRIIAGGNGGLLNIHSGSQITAPTTVPDGGSTAALLGTALLGLAGLKRKFAV